MEPNESMYVHSWTFFFVFFFTVDQLQNGISASKSYWDKGEEIKFLLLFNFNQNNNRAFFFLVSWRQCWIVYMIILLSMPLSSSTRKHWGGYTDTHTHIERERERDSYTRTRIAGGKKVRWKEKTPRGVTKTNFSGWMRTPVEKEREREVSYRTMHKTTTKII